MGRANDSRFRGMLRSVRRPGRALTRRRSAASEAETIDGFHHLYYDLGRHGEATWCDTRWFGAKVYKSPHDLWIYQEILSETRPDLIIETGTAAGGSALFLAMMCDLIGTGEVITVDVNARPGRPVHDRIRYVHGSSLDPEIVAEITAAVGGRERVMVLLDSDHSRDHVLGELEVYAPLVTSGCYLIVEDTNVNGHPVNPGFGPGPFEAVQEFLAHDDAFAQDRQRERYLVTFNPGGYLRRR